MKIKLILYLLLAFSFNACIYLDVKTPLDKDVNQTEIGSKVGVSKSHSILWLVAWGDAGTAAAAEDGDITTISHLDVRYYSVFFGAYARRETIAYGE